MITDQVLELLKLFFWQNQDMKRDFCHQQYIVKIVEIERYLNI
jgi:hypothetical protein